MQHKPLKINYENNCISLCKLLLHFAKFSQISSGEHVAKLQAYFVNILHCTVWEWYIVQELGHKVAIFLYVGFIIFHKVMPSNLLATQKETKEQLLVSLKGLTSHFGLPWCVLHIFIPQNLPLLFCLSEMLLLFLMLMFIGILMWERCGGSYLKNCGEKQDCDTLVKCGMGVVCKPT